MVAIWLFKGQIDQTALIETDRQKQNGLASWPFIRPF